MSILVFLDQKPFSKTRKTPFFWHVNFRLLPLSSNRKYGFFVLCGKKEKMTKESTLRAPKLHFRAIGAFWRENCFFVERVKKN